MNHFEENEIKYLKKQKKIRKCRSVWQKIIRKSLGCTKQEIKKSIANSKRERERVISILYGSVFRGNKYLLYTKKWRGNTLNEIINQDKKNYMNLKNLKSVDTSYFCRLAFGYVDQNDSSNFTKGGQPGQLKSCDPQGNTNPNGNGDPNNSNGNDSGNVDLACGGATAQDGVCTTAEQSGHPGGCHSNKPTSRANAKKTQPNQSQIMTRKKTSHSDKNTPINEKEEVYEKLNYLEKRSYRNRAKVDNYNSLNGGTNSSSYYYYGNQYGNGSANLNSTGNYYSVGSNDSAARNANGRNANGRNVNGRTANSRSSPKDATLCEPQSDENTMIKYKYLPTGVFYSRVSRSFIANWIDYRTKKQIKMPYKIAEFGIEKCMILAILSRNLRISNLNNALKCYDNLTSEQKEQMLQAIRTTQKSEKLFNDLLKPNAKDMSNGLHSRASPNAAADGQTNEVNVQTDMVSGQPDQRITQSNQLTALSNNEQEQKRTAVKKTGIEKKKVKQSYNSSENLPTGVYFYQGSYVANWWETQQKKQFKVPFKISEHGITRAKNLAIIARIIRSSSVQQVNLILSQIEQTKNITKLNYAAIAALAFKYINPPPKKE
ncbi:hypothetical protein AK88_04068 [Plasmodium fragile]|uniref:Uncharacterized protein n=1 Tax=Plasmodium fragile TaxID=5857 RepID=A0A0D9QGX3_PLAFR|nr:uncharacterized protein AK88_04068 [Plasmodium fragile]KJP86254.1 hypothetical protein AK88_04068 [Plasmodium fragile]